MRDAGRLSHATVAVAVAFAAYARLRLPVRTPARYHVRKTTFSHPSTPSPALTSPPPSPPPPPRTARHTRRGARDATAVHQLMRLARASLCAIVTHRGDDTQPFFDDATQAV